MSATDVPRITDELAGLLAERPHFVEHLRKLGSASGAGLGAAAPLYDSLEMWGGMGAVADEAGIDLPPAQRRRVLELLISLVREFEAAGLRNPRAANWASTFTSWLDSGVIDGEPAR